MDMFSYAFRRSLKSARKSARGSKKCRGQAFERRLRLEPLEDRSLLSVTLYVSPAGSDSNPGTLASPYLTIGKAATVLATQYSNTGGNTVNIEAGTYRGPGNSQYAGGAITTLAAGCSGTVGNPNVFQAYPRARS